MTDSDSGSEPDYNPGLGAGQKRSYGSHFVSGNNAEELADGDPSNFEPPQKVSKTSPQKQYSDVAQKLMAKMGYQKGTGLGKDQQGRVDIIEASLQRGRRGLGLNIKGFEESEAEWDFQSEEVIIDEIVEWLPVCPHPIPDYADMEDWAVEGSKKLIIEDETEFCDGAILADVLNSKSAFDNLEGDEMRRARTRSNPYETLRGGIYQNRAAMKMANMDEVLEFMFTNPKDKDGKPFVNPKDPKDLLYFADICAGPGGFSEYVLWRKKCNAKGFGFTLKGGNDFKLEDFFAAPSECFEPHYGVGGAEGDGNIFNSENMEAFKQFVMDSTENKGVHFVMADGGFSVDGKENIQEILSKQLYLCQFCCAMSILREGGNFICKLFDLFTPFSVGLVYLMWHAFERVSIYKPVTSRPANSERYIVCKNLKPNVTSINDYFFNVNQKLNKLSGILSQRDIISVVPLDNLKDDKPFYNYVINSNESLAVKQVLALSKIKTFASNTSLYESRQAEVREACLKKWQVPDEVRSAPARLDAPSKFIKLMGDDADSLEPEAITLNPLNLREKIKNVYDYRVMILGQEKTHYLLSLGRTNVFQWSGHNRERWRKLENIKLELPRDTLIEAGIVQELRGEGKGQRKSNALHIIDVLFIYGEDVRKLHYTERMTRVQKLVKAVNKPSRSDLVPLRCKDVYRLEEINLIFDRIESKLVKGHGQNPKDCYCSSYGTHFIPQALQLVKITAEPWMMALSKSSGRKYFYNIQTKQNQYEVPIESIASYGYSNKHRYLWPIAKTVTSPQDLINFVYDKK